MNWPPSGGQFSFEFVHSCRVAAVNRRSGCWYMALGRIASLPRISPRKSLSLCHPARACGKLSSPCAFNVSSLSKRWQAHAVDGVGFGPNLRGPGSRSRPGRSIAGVPTKPVRRRPITAGEKSGWLPATMPLFVTRPAAKSINAGDYVCNYSMYVMLEELESARASMASLALFISPSSRPTCGLPICRPSCRRVFRIWPTNSSVTAPRRG